MLLSWVFLAAVLFFLAAVSVFLAAVLVFAAPGPRGDQGGPREGPGRAQGGPRGCWCLADKFYYATDHFGPSGAQGPILRGAGSHLNLALQLEF